MQRAGRYPIKVRQVPPANGPQSIQIEVRIAQFERIEGPLDQTNSTVQSLFALKQFQHPANPAVPMVPVNGSVVGVQKRPAVAPSAHRQGVADEFTAHKRAQDLATGIRCHDEHGRRLDLQVLFTPDFALQLHTVMEFRQSVALSHDDASAHRRCSASLAENFSSPRFAESQRASISPREISWNRRPVSEARRSISRKRRRNFALAFFKAISGSTCRKRARFIPANNRSPSSSSTFRPSFACNARWSSEVSSRTLSKMPAGSSQSKPMRAAFLVNCRPSSSAGSVRGTPSSTDAGSFSFSAGVLFLFCARRSSALICSQFLSTSAASFARLAPKTWGCLRTIFSCTPRITSATVKRPSSVAICEWNTICSKRSPISSANLASSPLSRASRTS